MTSFHRFIFIVLSAFKYIHHSTCSTPKRCEIISELFPQRRLKRHLAVALSFRKNCEREMKEEKNQRKK